MYQAVLNPVDPLPPLPVSTKIQEVSPSNEFLKQLYVPSTYNNDLSSTKKGLDIIKAMKSSDKNLLPDLMKTYELDFDTVINSSGDTLAHICAAYNRTDLLKYIQNEGGIITI